jgi:hypothetical protein
MGAAGLEGISPEATGDDIGAAGGEPGVTYDETTGGETGTIGDDPGADG